MGLRKLPKHFHVSLLIAFLSAFILTSSFFARGPIRAVSGTVTKVSDGDTIHVTTPEQTKLKVRLYGIDAPETPKINHRTGHVNKPWNPLWEGILEGIRTQNYGKAGQAGYNRA